MIKLKIEAFIFDLDGTLLDTLEDLKNSVNYALSRENYKSRSFSEVRAFIGDGVEALMARAAPDEISDSLKAQLLANFRSHYREHCADCTVAYDNIVAVVAELKTRGYKIGVVSNKSDDEVVKLSKKFFGSSVDYALGRSPQYPRKPNPAGLLHAISKLGASAATSVYIGDSDIDIQTAKNAKVLSVGVAWGFRGREVLFKEGADIIIDAPAELLTLVERVKCDE